MCLYSIWRGVESCIFWGVYYMEGGGVNFYILGGGIFIWRGSKPVYFGMNIPKSRFS